MNINWSPILRDPHSSIYLSIVALKRLGFIKRFINRYVHDITPINVDTIGLNIFYKKFWAMCQTPNSEIWSSKRDDISLIILKPLVLHAYSKTWRGIQYYWFLITWILCVFINLEQWYWIIRINKSNIFLV